MNLRTYTFHEVRNCNMCGQDTTGHRVLGQRMNRSQGLRPRRKTGITVSVQQCGRCGLIYSQPMPLPARLEDHYDQPADSYWKPEYFHWTPEIFSEELRVIAGLLPTQPGRKALDVGAGLGKCMLSLERAGFEAHGLEPSPAFWKKAQEFLKIDPERLRLGQLETVEYAPQSFDLIVFGAVLEHLPDPAAALERGLGWLKPGGLIQLEVPSSDWLVGRLLNLYYRLIGTNYVTNLSPMHVPFHLYEFTLKSFEHLGNRLGFDLAHHMIAVCDMTPVPKPLHPLLSKVMRATRTGMQLILFLRAR